MKKFVQKKPGTKNDLSPREPLTFEEEISRRAYELWEAAGRQHGEDMAHWLAAEREVQVRRRLNENRLEGFR